MAVIGAGISGAMIARELSKYDLSVCILEKESDVAMGSTKANSAIVHAGFDALPGTLKAKFNVEGSKMFEAVCKELGVKYKKIGALVTGFDGDFDIIKELYARGIANGVEGLEIISDRTKLEVLEPNIGKEVRYALYAPTSAITCPYELCIAAIGNAMDNGVELKLNWELSSIAREKSEDGKDAFVLKSSSEDCICADIVINAAGAYADKVAEMIGDNSFNIHARKGEYVLLDKTAGSTVHHTVFRCPGKMGKGVLVSPTVDGNLLIGPSAEDIEDKDDTTTHADSQSYIKKLAAMQVESIDFRKSITYFTGIRSVGSTGDFIINENNGFINAAGIESPGLSSAPAIGKYVAKMVCDVLGNVKEKSSFNPNRIPDNFFSMMSLEEKNKYIKEHPEFGHTICRCESVTEGEILHALHTNPKAHDLDGVKRRTRAQMGRCQGGFCSPYITMIIARELGIDPLEVTKFGGNSKVLVSKTK